MRSGGDGTPRRWALRGGPAVLGGAWIVVATAVAPVAHAEGSIGLQQVGATVVPRTTRIGEPVIYRGRAIFYYGPERVKWLPPEPEPDLTWGEPRARRAYAPRVRRESAAGRPAPEVGWDTLYVEIPLQVFRPGLIILPGLRFQDQDPAHPEIHRLPVASLVVMPVLSAADSNAEFRPPRGPLRAPWYERVPWRWVVLGLAALVGLVLLVRWARSRRPAVTPAPPRALDPAARALAELAELRALRLPANERYGEHALHLTRILRRYLEAVAHSPRPGHTTPELVVALSRSPLGPDQVQTLGAMLRVWDRLKFARESSSVKECERAEAVVEGVVRDVSRSAEGKAA